MADLVRVDILPPDNLTTLLFIKKNLADEYLSKVAALDDLLLQYIAGERNLSPVLGNYAPKQMTIYNAPKDILRQLNEWDVV